MRRLFSVFTIFYFILFVASAARSSEEPQRLGFVVGVDKYDKLGPHAQLKRAVNDAKSVGRALRGLGYRVIQKSDLNRSEFYSQWQSFLNRVKPGDEVVLYYSGHGIEIDGQNYLLPRNIPDVKYGRETQVKRESISLQDLILDLREKKPRVSLIILDACRNHPLVPPEFKGLTQKSGLTNVYAPEGTFIMYSAGAGETALDRLPGIDPDNVNSVYTRKLLPLLITPGLGLAEMAKRLRSEVYDLVKPVPHLQRPAYYDGVIGRYCLAGCRLDGTTASKTPKKNIPEDTSSKSVATPAHSVDQKSTAIQKASEFKQAEQERKLKDFMEREVEVKRRAELKVAADAKRQEDEKRQAAEKLEQKKELIRKIQKRLADLGCYQKSIDGYLGPESRSAWKKATDTHFGQKEPTVKDLERLASLPSTVCLPPSSKTKARPKIKPQPGSSSRCETKRDGQFCDRGTI